MVITTIRVIILMIIMIALMIKNNDKKMIISIIISYELVTKSLHHVNDNHVHCKEVSRKEAGEVMNEMHT